jgi:hypothetical protein
MNSFPTVLNPWYVVARWEQLGFLGQALYYTSQGDDADSIWTEDQKKAMFFLNLNSAIRVAKSERAEVLVLWDKAQLPAYGRDVGR